MLVLDGRTPHAGGYKYQSCYGYDRLNMMVTRNALVTALPTDGKQCLRYHLKEYTQKKFFYRDRLFYSETLPNTYEDYMNNSTKLDDHVSDYR